MHQFSIPSCIIYRPMCYRGHGRPLFMVHDDWNEPFTCMVFNNLVIVLLIMQLKKIVKADGLFLTAIVVTALWDICFLLTLFLNPGIKPHQKSQPSLKMCQECNLPQEQGQRHCSVCHTCISGQHHHCGWFGKCIGRYNIIPYYLFLILGLTIMYCLGMACLLLTH